MKDSPPTTLKFLGNFAGLLLLLCIIVSLVCLAKFLYFPGEIKAVSPQYSPREKFTKTVERPLEAGHFHILDKAVYSDDYSASMCLQCHGNFCHTRSKELRSFYNMHTFYLACETCHIRQEQDDPFVFEWFDTVNGTAVKEPKGMQGSYKARIVPLKDGKRLDDFPKKGLALEFMKHQDSYSEQERKRIQEELMQHISKEAITCDECHVRNGYLNLTVLGYRKERIEELSQLKVIKLIKEYDSFFLPTIFDPRQSEGRKEG